MPNSEIAIELFEGVSATNDYLVQACTDHLKDILKQKDQAKFTHTGSDKSTYKDRIERYCQWDGSIFEALDFSPRSNATDIVVAWLVDDGNPKRTHRLQLLNQNFKQIGVSVGIHPLFNIKCSVALFSQQIKPIQINQIQKQINTRLEKISKIDFQQFSQEVFQLINKVRTDPQHFIKYLEKCLSRFEKGNILVSSDKQLRIQTKEGPFAYIEAIEFLRVQKQLKGFKWNQQLSLAAKDHALDLSTNNKVGIMGSDGSLPQDRIARYCNVNEQWAESTVFGCSTASEVVEQLIVNDGQPQVRGYRATLFNKNEMFVGIYGATHPDEQQVTLLVFAKGILIDGQQEKVHVTVTDKVPYEVMHKMKQMGIDTNRIKVIQDTSSKITEQRATKIFGKQQINYALPRTDQPQRPQTAKVEQTNPSQTAIKCKPLKPRQNLDKTDQSQPQKPQTAKIEINKPYSNKTKLSQKTDIIKSKDRIEEDKKRKQQKQKDLIEFNIDEDPDFPASALNSHIQIEEIEINGHKQRVFKKSYQMLDGTIQNVTRIQQLH